MQTLLDEGSSALPSRPFGAHRDFLRREVLPELSRGADHNGIESRFDEVLFLAERLLLSSAATVNHGDLPRRIGKILAEATASRFSGIDLVVDCLEAWLKLLLERIDPAHYQANIGNKSFTLYPVVEKLDLLTHVELGELPDRITDLVRRSIRKLHQSTRGIPLYVQHKAEQVREQGGNHLAVDPAEGNQVVFRGQLNRWKQPDVREEVAPLYQTLLLLSIFEPLSPLDVHLIQGYLAHRSLSIGHGQLKNSPRARFEPARRARGEPDQAWREGVRRLRSSFRGQ